MKPKIETVKERQTRILNELAKKQNFSYSSPPTKIESEVKIENDSLPAGFEDFKYAKESTLSSLCTPPYSIAWKIYNKIAGTMDCSCCVFWRGFIFATLVWWWTAIAIVIALLIHGK